MTASTAARRRTLRPFFTADRRFPASFPNRPKTALCARAGPHPQEALRFSAFVCDTITPRQQDNVNTFFTPFEAGPRAEQARIRARFAADAHRPKAPHFAGFHAVAVHVVYHSYF